MKKLLFTLCMASLIFACTKSDQITKEVEIDALSEAFDDSNFGNYKGVFTTNDSETRGIVDVTITPTETKATITTEAGVVHEFYNKSEIIEGEVTDVLFEGSDGSFNFAVGSDGTDVAITEVMYQDKASAILSKKNTAKASVNPVTGTYNCNNCNSGQDANAHPFFTVNSVKQTFSFIFTNGTTGSGTIQTQIMYDDNDYTTGSGNEGQLNNSVTNSGITSLDDVPDDGNVSIGGTSTVLSNVDWEGTHNYSGSLSSISGFWDFDAGDYIMTGTFQANEMYISELNVSPASDEFIEITGIPSQSLEDIVLVLFNGSNDQSYRKINLDGQTFDSTTGKLVIGKAGVANVDITLSSSQSIQDGPDAIALYRGAPSSYNNGTPATTSNLISAIVYGTGQPDDTALLTALGESIQYDEDGEGDKEGQSINFDELGNFTLAVPTPGL